MRSKRWLLHYFVCMKTFYLVCFCILLVIGFSSAISSIKQEKAVSDAHIEIVLREIGHKLLLHAKDSVSRVLPVQRLNENTYQISFQNNLVFIPDTLINLVQTALEKYHLPLEYMVNVKDCQQKQTIFAYEINKTTGNLLPCTGREQQSGCYLIQISFLPTEYFNFYYLFLLIPLGFLAFYISGRLKQKQLKTPLVHDNSFIQLGGYMFYADRQLLSFDNQNINLSANETKALKIFAANPNQIIEREMLMKEIWENQGIMVISRNVDVLVSKLRKKLSDDSAIKIINIHGRGYKFLID
jgi:Transcriptional regulatory protein, C terminal